MKTFVRNKSIRNKSIRNIRISTKKKKYTQKLRIKKAEESVLLYSKNFYNKSNIEKFSNYVKILEKKQKSLKKTKIPMNKRTRYMVKKFKYINKHLDKENYYKKNDFYTFINKQWLSDTDIERDPRYYSKYDDFRVVQEKVYYQLIEYVKTFIRANGDSKKAIAINNVYKSMMTNTPKHLLEHCKTILKEIEGFMCNSSSSVYDVLADLNQNEIIAWSAPIWWCVLPDEKNVTKYISHLACGSLSIYDYSVYESDEGKKSVSSVYESDVSVSIKENNKFKHVVKREFLKCIGEIFNACLGADHGFNPQDVWDVEVELANEMNCSKGYKTDPDAYNVATSTELEDKYNLNWSLFATKLGYKEVPKKVIVEDLNSLQCTILLLEKKWKTPKWKTYWLYIHYKQIIRFDKTWRHIYFNFFEKILKGRQVEMPDDIYPIYTLSMCFNTFLTNQYVEHNYNALYVNYTKDLCDNLIALFVHKLMRNTWLSPSTKEKAITKLKKIKSVIGSPENLRYDPLFNYTDDDPWSNLRLLTNWKFRHYINLEGKNIIDIPEIDWQDLGLSGTQAYIVNAYYTPTSNSIYLPLAYLQPPFIDLTEKGLEYNLAFVGYTIAHELSHCLDDSGSRYDENGNLSNWWTKSDRAEFDNKIKDIVKQYRLFAARDGLELAKDIDVGEDLADISGMALIEEYLRDNLIVRNDTDIIKHVDLQKLYIYLAIQGKQKILKKAIKSELKTNPHPLEKYRVNCCLARLELFKTIYDIKKGDGMWWHNNDTIW